MDSIVSEDFLLHSNAAHILYHNYAKHMPIADYHCHINLEEIVQDRRFDNITQLILGGDHYKWRSMRSNGIDEYYITGASSDYEKFTYWAKTLPKAIGNPLYHWTHLELKRFFGYEGALNEKTADDVWSLCNSSLKQPDFSVRGIIKRSNVKVICTTDDPIDSLSAHRMLAADKSFSTKVFPTWRPDKCLNIERTEFAAYIRELSAVSGVDITDYPSLTAALIARLDYFDSHGCKSSDHAISAMFYAPAGVNTINRILKKVLTGEAPAPFECEQYKTELLLFLARQYHERNWAMQLHCGALHDRNTRMYESLGPNTGFDCIGGNLNIRNLSLLFDALESNDQLPRTIVYSLNPVDDAAIGALIGCFQGTEVAGKLQHGPAWWFNDTETGIIAQMTALANFSLLGNFIGMLTDSRSFLSYSRHEYFRRILCNLIGGWVEAGEYPSDIPLLGKMVEDISYNNAVSYFNLI